jgi:hypothetical protein
LISPCRLAAESGHCNNGFAEEASIDDNRSSEGVPNEYGPALAKPLQVGEPNQYIDHALLQISRSAIVELE